MSKCRKSRDVKLLHESLDLPLLACPRTFKHLLVLLLLLLLLLLALHSLPEAVHRPLHHRVRTDPTDPAQ